MSRPTRPGLQSHEVLAALEPSAPWRGLLQDIAELRRELAELRAKVHALEQTQSRPRQP